jgi:hypothetical protein
MFRLLVVCSFVAALCAPAARVAAQTFCGNASPWYYEIARSCTTTDAGGACPPNTPVTLSLSAYYPEWSPTSCATVEWSFGDGSPVVTASGAQPVTHQYAATGTYYVRAAVRTPNYAWATYRHMTVTVANGTLRWEGAAMTEGGRQRVIVYRTNASGPTSLAWSLRNSGATPTDVTPTSGVVTFADGEFNAAIEFNSTEDSVYTGDRTYSLVAGAATGGYLPPNDHAFLQIQENDYAYVGFASPVFTVREDAGVATITVLRTGNTALAGSVDYYVSGQRRIASTSGRLVFAPGETSKSFQVIVLDDALWLGPQTATMTLYARTTGMRVSTQNATINVEEDDPQPIFSVNSVSVVEGDAGQRSALVVVTAPYSVHAAYRYTTGEGSATSPADYITSSNILAFNGTNTATFTIPIVGDRSFEEDETFLVHFSPHPTPNAGPAPAPPAPVTVTILNDDAGLTPDDFTISQGGSTTATLILGTPAATPLTVALSSSRPELITVPATVTVPAGATRVSFELQGVRADSAATVRITAELPAAHGGAVSTMGKVLHPGRVTFEPKSIQAYPGQEVPIRVVVAAPTGRSYDIRLSVANPSVVSAPAAVTILPDGTGTFTVKALKTGTTRIEAAPAGAEHDLAFVDIVVATPAKTPTLASLTPAIGPTAGGTEFSAFGSNLTADCTLTFGGVPAANVTLGANGTMSGTAPAHPAGTVDVVLSCGTSTYVLTNAFTYMATPPALKSIAPSFGSTSGGTLVRAAGTNFQSGCWMFFGGVPASAVEVDSTSSMTAIAPPRADGGAVETRVQCGNLSAALPASFAYTTAVEPSASLISVDPLIGAPGESVTMTGSRFHADDKVRFDGTNATILRTRSDEHVVRIPEMPLGMSSLTLVDAAGRVITTGPIFMIVEAAPPRVERVVPGSTLAGSDVTLHGRGFRPAYSFAIGGHAAHTISLAYDRAVVRVSENVAEGTHQVHVVNSEGKIASVGAVVNVRAGSLRLRGASPACGTTDGGMVVTLTGNGFAPSATVTFNGVPATEVTVVSETEIRATTPAGATGAATIAVRNGASEESISSAAFRYVSPFDPQGCGSSTGRSRSVRR